MVRLYVEGGFEGSTKSDCRRGFSTFLGKVIRQGSFKVIASGSRRKAYEDFCSALRQHSEDYVILLVDSETSVNSSPWRHLASREGDHWPHPTGAGDDQAHLMVQVMESWFLADKETLSAFYGQGFFRNSLPGQKDIEQIDKGKIFDALRQASRSTQKGAYHKTRHGFELLEEIDPSLVRSASRHVENLFIVLAREAQAA